MRPLIGDLGGKTALDLGRRYAPARPRRIRMSDDDDSPVPEPGRKAPEAMAIRKIEILDQEPGGAALLIWTKDSDEPVVIRFDERATAIAYVRDIWDRRQRRHQQDDD